MALFGICTKILFSPPAIAIQDDSDMVWSLGEIKLTQQATFINRIKHRLYSALYGVRHLFLKSLIALRSAMNEATGKVPAKMNAMVPGKLLRDLRE